MLIVNLSLDKSKISQYISFTLLNKIEENLKNNKKIILYLNKRWEYSSLVCKDCQYIYKCQNCDVNLNVHKNPEKLACHICWYSQDINISCEKCWWINLLKIWVWTEQIEEVLKKYFQNSDIKIFRFDLDNLKNKTLKNNALEEINKSNIIIWTKMITTWFDIRNIWLIWIILIEQELVIPNYNTEQVAYTNISQIIWRWNRRWEKTDIIIQSFSPANKVVKALFEKNYKDFFKYSLEERRLFNYPPFKQMAILEYRHKDKQKSILFMIDFKDKLDEINVQNNIEIIYNEIVFRKNNKYHIKIILKWDNLRIFLENIKAQIIKNSDLSLSFI